MNKEKMFSNGYALLVGVGNYKKTSLSVPITAQDAEDMGGILKNPQLCGYPQNQVVTLTHNEANTQRILTELVTLKERVQQDDNATVVIFFSGHGWRQEHGYYFLPHETELFKQDGKFRINTETVLSNETFLEHVRQIPAKRLVLFFDTCFAGGFGTSLAPEVEQIHEMSPVPLGLFDPLLAGSGRVIISSSQAHEKSWIKNGAKNSLFAAHLLDALQGKGLHTKENTIRILDVFNALSISVPQDAQTINAVQTPVLKAYDVTQNFSMALLLGGKGLSPTEQSSDATPVQSNPNKKGKLVNALLTCPCMRHRDTRDAIVDELPDNIKNTIQRNTTDKVDVRNIVTRCLDFKHGFHELIKTVRDYEGDSLGMQQVDSIIRQM
ncbi:MAG: caspase family protein [Candidatus Electrothrix sp. AUS3]|nr:caspase family protein [Candidatus Electrothrix gigas]